MRLIISIFLSTIVIFCSFPALGINPSYKMLVLNYSDFGPQEASYKLLGFNWWQWDDHGNSDPKTECDIKVVVYKNIKLKDVQKLYPVVQKKQQDYRYIEYAVAVNYLDHAIAEWQNDNSELIVDMVRKLKKTRIQIIGDLENQ